MELDERFPDSLDTPERRLDPFPWYETMRENEPVRYDEDRHCWDVFRYDDVKRVLTDHERFSSAGASDFDPMGMLATTLVDVDPPEHDQLRGIVDEYFEPGNLRKLRPSIRSIVDEQLDRALADGPDVEVLSEVTAPVTVLTISRLLGLSPDQRDVFRKFSSSMNTDEADLAKIFGLMREYFEGLIQDRRQNPQEDLLSVIADQEVSLSEEKRTSFCIMLFLAGHETTTHAVGNALWTLEEEGLYEALRDGEIDREQTFDESLRYRPPFYSVSGRRTTEEVELNGTVIPAGERVTSWVTSANRDPRKFDDPEQFNPDRRPNPHLAFGSGPHYCLGAPLAKLEGDIIFKAVTDRVETIELGTDKLVPNPGTTRFGLKRLPMRFNAR
ncbi:cytochrome P450 (plasmid) [Haloferax sp. S1W]|uniref:cytochrome P450 n=1 Tax=Haloferax sp. S1W TaxID=3377110 RepID=UPI0037C690B4